MKSFSNIQAISVSVVLFITLHFLLTLVSNYLSKNSSSFLTLLPWLNLLAYLLYLLTGFISSLLAKSRLIITGLAAGLLSAFIAVLAFGVGGDIFWGLLTLAFGFILGGIGGGISMLLKMITSEAL
ncbi:hypothetical protein [Marinimicrobium sp. ABcell2]|uniref:hypothetical protein n=1 Tax=Marinimicrobium sp. ABcell2 TaxID=3069751 RepID=UPI0027B814C4|nr:hypothetical protein [Marinimicrobium sp. ABcell2]MDQ2077940.1 hypothetical protein [Marinimicrobium sp. ABcell2]